MATPDDGRLNPPDDRDEPAFAYVSHQQGLPADAVRLGMDRNTEEGALIAMAGSLNSSRPLHRLVAWALLACFVAPVVFTLAHEFF